MRFRCILLPALVALGMADAQAGIVPDVPVAQAAANAFAPPATRDAVTSRESTTSHSLVLRGRHLRYQATVKEWPVQGPSGRSIGVIVTEAYVVPAAKGTTRPVTFVYNGGPGASSWPLQMEGIGPRVYDASRGTIVDNPASILDTTDLVFIDPLGTGASFPLKGEDASSAWNTPGDARATIEVIDGWLRANGRGDSPHFLLGESYGTLRDLAILHVDAEKPKLNLSGVILLSLVVGGIHDDDLQSIALLPSLAMAAYAHDLRRIPASSPDQAYADALRFARTRYASALLQGDRLSADERHDVAVAMSEQIGVPAAAIEAANLRLDASGFRHELASAHPGLLIGNLDTRRLGDATLEAFPSPYDDPSMTLGRRPGALMEGYLRELGYRIAAPYRPLNLYINRHYWYFGDTPPTSSSDDTRVDAVPWLVDAMKANPRLRVFSAGGYYDTNTPLYEGQYVLEHASLDPARWTSKAYASGHTIAEDPVQRVQLSSDLRRFISSGSDQTDPP